MKGFQHARINNLIENFNLSGSSALVFARFKAVLVIQPSSAFVERAFSFPTNNAFDSQQDRVLED